MEPVILVHGGAGNIEAGREAACRAGCRRAAVAGHAVLSAGGAARAAVVAAVKVLEDDPELNAGLGACLTREGRVELDAAVMDGARLALGAVGAIEGVRNPIALADAVLEDGEHALLVGDGAIQFAREHGIPLCAPESLITERARRRWQDELARLSGATAAGAGSSERGTVGAVAIDAAGHVSAATSTGGIAMKRHGRVGDTPLAGCGTYADDRAGAASATGHGEYIMRLTLTRRVAERMAGGLDPTAAAAAALAELRERLGAVAGVIAIDREGRFGFARTTAGMPYAWVRGLTAGVEAADGV